MDTLLEIELLAHVKIIFKTQAKIIAKLNNTNENEELANLTREVNDLSAKYKGEFKKG